VERDKICPTERKSDEVTGLDDKEKGEASEIAEERKV